MMGIRRRLTPGVRGPSVRVRGPLAALVTAAAMSPFLGSCRSFDPAQFDGRLREATFDAYVETIETQFGGLSAAGVTIDELTARYRERAVSAVSPAGFYGELRAMLADLDDPHAALQVSPRFWTGPVAEPEWVQFVSLGSDVWIGMPTASVRTPEQLAGSIGAWLGALGAVRASDLDALGIAEFLRASAAFRPHDLRAEEELEKGVWYQPSYLDEIDVLGPLEWMRLRAIDGRSVESPHDAELLIRGAVGSVTELEVTLEAGGTAPQSRTLALLRNAGVFESDETAGGVRRRLNPLELADRLDPAGSGPFRGVGVRSPLYASRALRRAKARSAFRLGRKLDLPGPEAEAFGLEAWRLRTPGGAAVAYLRVNSFRGAVRDEGDPQSLTLYGPLEVAMDALRGIDHWIIDVTHNPGGSWQEAGLFVSYFLEPEDEVVPHEVTSVSTAGNLLFRTKTTAVHRLARVDVEPVRAKTVHVLADQDTASAGEIVASTLRGKAGAVLVGERTAGAEYSTAEFEAPDGSVLRIGLSGGMMGPYESFQGRGLSPDIEIEPFFAEGAPRDLEVWRTVFRYEALRGALMHIDEGQAVTR